MVELRNAGWNVVDLYTFGMPRTGNAAFAEGFSQMFDGIAYRVTHGRDPFVNFPNAPSYVHVEPEVFYKGHVDEGYVICTLPNDKTCSAQYFQEKGVVLDSAA